MKTYVKYYRGHEICAENSQFFVDDLEQGYETCAIAEDAIRNMPKTSIFNYTDSEIQEWIEKNFPVEKLNDAIKSQLGISKALSVTYVDFKIGKVFLNGESFYVPIESDIDISRLSPITKAAWRKMTLETFGSWVTLTEDLNLKFSACIQLSYEHWDRGHNGSSIGTVYFDEKKGFRYETCEEKESDLFGRVLYGGKS